MTGRNDKIGGGGFHHLAMRVRDFDASVKFYTEGLGFVPAIAWGEGEKRAVMLDTGDGNYLELFAGGSAEPLPQGLLLHYALRTGNCDEALERARQAGAPVKVEPKTVQIPSNPPRTVRIAFCLGPDGEEIEFLQHLD